MKRCEVCKERNKAPEDWLCKVCGADYDRRDIVMGTVETMVTWSARRARRYERARQRRRRGT